MGESLKYRPEIDGLRTVAVAAVIVFHLNADWLVGGFLGVDVFFVISGYLITLHIYPKIAAGSFSILDFWRRRIKRLYPALIAMTGFVMLVGPFLLVPPERGQLVLQAAAAVFSFQNILLTLTTGGYWSAASENIPLLHTWSLSLEEQFYICFPLLLLLTTRWNRKVTIFALTATLLVSLGLSIAMTAGFRKAAFYLLPTRMWELLMGSLLAILCAGRAELPASRSSNLVQGGGMVLILASFGFIADGDTFPGFLPLFPSIGTLLLLAYGWQAGVVKRALSLAPIVYLGKISYSLYLWHWPIIVFLKYINPSFSPALALLLTFLLACLSYHFIECPFRYNLKRPRMALTFAALASGLCMLPAVIFPSSPFLRDFADVNSSTSLTRGDEFEATDKIRLGKLGVIIGNGDESIDICVVGSSHARVLCTAVAGYCEANGLSFVSMSTSSTGISVNAPTKLRPDGDVINLRRLADISKVRPKVVIVAGMWSGEIKVDSFRDGLKDALIQIAPYANRVIVLGQPPLIALPKDYKGAFRKYCVALKFSGESVRLLPSDQVPVANAVVAEVVESLGRSNVSFINPYDLFISPDGSVKICDEKSLYYSDDNHVNDAGARRIFEKLESIIELGMANR